MRSIVEILLDDFDSMIKFEIRTSKENMVLMKLLVVNSVLANLSFSQGF